MYLRNPGIVLRYPWVVVHAMDWPRNPGIARAQTIVLYRSVIGTMIYYTNEYIIKIMRLQYKVYKHNR